MLKQSDNIEFGAVDFAVPMCPYWRESWPIHDRRRARLTSPTENKNKTPKLDDIVAAVRMLGILGFIYIWFICCVE